MTNADTSSLADTRSRAETYAALRRDYAGEPLDEKHVAASPIQQFQRWFDEAVKAGVAMANGFSLATVDVSGQPSARIVLLKGCDNDGFTFYTNYTSRKASELEANPRASMCFWWEPLERQVRIEGRVERVSAAESDAYFSTRPRAANLSGMASPQSQVVNDRAELKRAVADVDARWQDKALERPASWGGYRIVPERIEFWQGRPDRLHDRLRYRRQDTTWCLERLAP